MVEFQGVLITLGWHLQHGNTPSGWKDVCVIYIYMQWSYFNLLCFSLFFIYKAKNKLNDLIGTLWVL